MARVSAPTGKQSSVPSGAWPTETYFGGQKDLFFNGEVIQLIHEPNAHTDGDSMVHFRKSDVLAMGDIFTLESYPVIDTNAGGTVQGMLSHQPRAGYCRAGVQRRRRHADRSRARAFVR
jgi:cyclase